MGFINLVISSNYHASPTQLHHPNLQSFKLQRGGGERKDHLINFNPTTTTNYCPWGLTLRHKEAKMQVPICSKGTDTTEMIDFQERQSALEVRKEIEQCYELIHRLGRGVIYIGSSRPSTDHPHYMQALELSKQVAELLNSTTWTGAGPGLMDAAIKGALQAGKPVGGLKIEKEAGQWASTGSHPYLPSDTYLTCRFFSARKHGFVDAAVRNCSSDRTAVIALPGGIGTLDEMFEILALIQLQRIGSLLPVPFLLMNYDAYYTKLLDFLNHCEHWGTVAKGEVDSLWKVFSNNSDALQYLAEFYDLPLINVKSENLETTIS